MASLIPPPVQVARRAMNTRFEIVLSGRNPVALRAAGEEALDEIERLEARLSLFQPTSEIAHVNDRAAREAVRVSLEVFGLLQQAKRLHEESRGAFDITVGPLMRCWGFRGGEGRIPSPEDLASARECCGMHLVEFDPKNSTVRFVREGVMLDLGAIGKGYAIERAADILREAGVTSALLHGGTSTVYGLGAPLEAEAWKIGIEYGQSRTGVPPVQSGKHVPAHEAGPHFGGAVLLREDRRDACPALLAVVGLRDEALSVSAVWGRAFRSGGQTFGHVIDPRTGQPTTGAMLAAVVLPSATESDALSTALLTSAPVGHDYIAALRPGMRTLVAWPEAGSGKLCIKANGITPLAAT
jgi:thiamine biosynthesis lipoprotein